MAVEAGQDLATESAAFRRIGEQLGITPEEAAKEFSSGVTFADLPASARERS